MTQTILHLDREEASMREVETVEVRIVMERCERWQHELQVQLVLRGGVVKPNRQMLLHLYRNKCEDNTPK